MNRIDWDQQSQEVVPFLQTLIRINTTNPPGNEIEAARWLAERLREVGIEPAILESAPGRANLVARLPGTGEEAPLLLMSHTDVVGVEPDKWERPPFGGELHDGWIWGRGALDMKHIVAQHLTLMRHFKRLADQGVRLKRDLIMMAAADEERAGTFGAQWLVQHHPDLLRAEYALNEGGGHTQQIGEALFMSVQTAEKGLARFKLTTHGEVGHGSMPREDNAVVRLAEAVAALGRARLPAHITPTVRAFFETLAAEQPPDVAELFYLMARDESRVDEALSLLPLDPMKGRHFHALTHNTVTPTILSAGSKVNVIPSEAVARVDGRILPGWDRERFLEELAPYLPEDITLEWAQEEGEALEAGLDSPLYSAIQASIAEHYPEVKLVPTLLTGATDAKAIVKLGTRVYGFSPAPYEPDVEGLSLVHGHNERISVRHLLFGARVLADVVWRFCGAA